MNKAIRLNPSPVDPRYAGIYSHGVAAPADTGAIYVSGQVGVGPDGELGESFAAQCERAIDNVAAVLAEAGAGLADIVKMTFFITNRRDMDELVRVRKARLDGVSPAITTVVVSGLVEPEWLVEVEALAHRPRPDVRKAGLPGQLGYTDLGF